MFLSVSTVNLTLVALLGFSVCPHVLVSLGQHASILFPQLAACNDRTLVKLVEPQWQVTILVLDGNS